jgi:hypothetical protein
MTKPERTCHVENSKGSILTDKAALAFMPRAKLNVQKLPSINVPSKGCTFYHQMFQEFHIMNLRGQI